MSSVVTSLVSLLLRGVGLVASLIDYSSSSIGIVYMPKERELR